MNAQQLWAAYREKSGVAHDNYTAWAFGGDPDGLAELVLAGKKRATCSLGRVYELTGEPIPRWASTASSSIPDRRRFASSAPPACG